MTSRDRPALFDEPDPVDQAAVVLFRVGELLSVRLNELVSEFGIRNPARTYETLN